MANARIYLKHPSGKMLYLGKRFGGAYYYEGQEHLEDILNLFFKDCWEHCCEEGSAETQDDFYIKVE